MTIARATLALFLACLALSAQAEPPSGTYSGKLNGTDTTLTLETRGTSVTGTYSEPSLTLSVRGTINGEAFDLELYEPKLNIAFADFEGISSKGRLVGQLSLSPSTGMAGEPVMVLYARTSGAIATTAAPAKPTASKTTTSSADLDRRLIGTWVNEDNINSGGGAGGFASFSTVMTMELRADGSIRQTTRSVGGGGDWSSDSGERVDFTGQWQARDGKLYVKGMGLTEFTEASRYSFSGDYLVTNNDMGRLIWQRR